MKKQILTIAEFDGWKQDKCDTLTKGRGLYKAWYHYEQIKKLYATNLNELQRVALDVLDELYKVYNCKRIYEAEIMLALTKRPVRGKYTHLVEAVAEGIEYINSTKNK